ncbi:hypothetical protein [Archangium sp.]|uniref:hypothetical protein n=1 Tax=Archangium sp. TaxID=1872627 RepID=UPI002ED895B1
MRPSTHPEPMTSRGPRLLALPLVLVCVLAYLGSVAHFFLVQHRTCLEHGDLVHEGEVEQGTALMKPRASFEDERIVRAEARVSVHGSDAHCAHVFLRRVAPPPVGGMLSSEVAVPSGPLLEDDGVVLEPPVAWLHLAPKSSPPRV